MSKHSASSSAIVALAAFALLLTACDSGSRDNEGSYRDRLLGRLPERAMDELQERGAEAIPDLNALILDPDPVVAQAGLSLVGMITPKSAAEPAIPTVVQALAYPNDGVRNIAIQTLTGLRSTAIPYILQALDNGNPVIREGALEVAAKGLGKEAKDGIGKFERIAQSGTDQEKTWAAMALASIGSAAERSLPILERAADSVKSENDKKMIRGCIKRIEVAHKPGMYTDSR